MIGIINLEIRAIDRDMEKFVDSSHSLFCINTFEYIH